MSKWGVDPNHKSFGKDILKIVIPVHLSPATVYTMPVINVSMKERFCTENASFCRLISGDASPRLPSAWLSDAIEID